ncbi:MAG: transcriptional repressor [Clostridia bacterium]|nr:transcriptional repressor [Clostridia bacterium]
MIGKRYSRQRELIYQALMNTMEHPTAEMVYSWLKPENPNLSLGTVYRNLNLLADEGAITRMPFPVERYDAETRPHPHFQCRSCGNVYDLEGLPYDSALDVNAAKCSGHDVERHEIVFSGTCKNCTQKH